MASDVVPVRGYKNLDLLVPDLIAIPVYDPMTGEKTEDVLVPDDLSMEATLGLGRLQEMATLGFSQEGLDLLAAGILSICRGNPAYGHWTLDDVRTRWSPTRQLVIVQRFLQSTVPSSPNSNAPA